MSKARPIGKIPDSGVMTTNQQATGTRPRLGEILVKAGVLTPEQLDDALRYQKETGQRIGDCLIQLGHARIEDITRALARQAGLMFVDIRRGTIPAEVLALVPKDVALTNNVLPVKLDGGTVILAVTDPLAVFNIEHLRFLLNLDFKCVLTAEPWMVEAFKRYFNVDKKEAKTVGDAPRKAQGVAKADDDAPIIRLAQQIFEDALRQRASDIHIEPMADRVRVRFRVDGVLQDHRGLSEAPSGRDHLAHQGHGRDGHRREAQAAGRPHQPEGARARTSTCACRRCPATHGESIVMRLLDKTRRPRRASSGSASGPTS